MKRIRKQSKHLIKELIDLRKSRKSIKDFNFNFLANFTENAILMHSHLGKDGLKKDLVEIASRQYFVFLISCWETFFRDIFIFIYSEDEESIKKLFTKMKITEDSLEVENITLIELLSKSFNFQNLNDLEDAYSSLWGSNFFEYICETKIDLFGFNGEFVKESSISLLFPEWLEIIKKSFSIRHKVVHDANYRIDLDINFIRKFETLFLIIPQFVTHFTAKRFKLDHIVLSDGRSILPNIFSIHDILANDWEVI